MNREVSAGILAIVLILTVVAASNLDSSKMTNAAISPSIKCTSPQGALNAINNKNCVRIYESEKCESQGKVEIICP